MGASNSAPVANVQGFQVGRVLPNSPAHLAGLCPFFDIITGVDDIALDLDSVEFFKDYVARNVNTPIRLTLFNLRVRVFRTVPITPSDSWGGVGLLGCAMEWSGAAAALELTWHIEGVDPLGPAAGCADLQASRDYIIGMQAPDEPVVTLFTHATFAEKMEGWRALRRTNTPMSAYERETLLLLVFDSEANSVKEVPVHMGNHMSLGVEIADGYLHFIPELVVSDPSEVPDKLPYVSKFVVSEAQFPQSATQQEEKVEAPSPSNEPTVVAEAVAPPLTTTPPPLPMPPATALPQAPQPPSFQSFLPAAVSQTGAPPACPSALPFPSFNLPTPPPPVRPTVPAPAH